MISNKKIGFEYNVLESEVAGMILDVKTIKRIAKGDFGLEGKYVVFMGEVPRLICQETSIDLLLTKKQINRFMGKVKTKGLTIVPSRIFQVRGNFKVEICLCSGKKEYDKREHNKNRDADLEAQRVVKSQKFSE